MTAVLFKFILIQVIHFHRVLHFSYLTAIRCEFLNRFKHNFQTLQKKVFNVLMVRRKSHYTIQDD